MVFSAYVPLSIVWKWTQIRAITRSTPTFTVVNRDPKMNIFDRKTKRMQRERTVFYPDSSQYNYLRDEIASRLEDRLNDTKNAFETVLELGSHSGSLTRHLVNRPGVKRIVQTDTSYNLLSSPNSKPEKAGVDIEQVVCDQEFLPFDKNSFDLVISNLDLHWVNDLPGTLHQIRESLKDNGLFLASMFGGQTLKELRSSFLVAEQEREGGISPRISPFSDVRDGGSLLTRCGYALIAVDVDEICVRYPDAFALMHDLRAMGESNAVALRRPFLKKETLMSAAAFYQEMYGSKEDGSVPATFQILYLTGWKPHASQPRPKKRGSATASLKDLDSFLANAPEGEPKDQK
eukprot:TRINITY_DN10493_c0_g1_i1.p1 TRINITY_DN10493_c0_g1~~TRINITY_DN10493_c0_g1_i1.p1  ORF type:complete len:347 (+),score=78.17 TRINITY_DN10493_c0_g1_i1:50-1090(+)